MTLLQDGITFLNFDGTYEYQHRLTRHLSHQWIDFRTLRGTSLYCSPEAFCAIRRKLAAHPGHGLTFIGSGNYHYVALALMEELSQPFTLILFDHHTDLNEGQLGSLLSCGSWVHQAIRRLPHLRQVIIIGPDPRTAEQVPLSIRRHVVIIPDSRLPEMRRLDQSIPTDHIRISIDKDVLSPEEARTNWDQGHLRLDELCRMIDFLARSKKTDGIDICGEWPTRPHEQFNPQAVACIHKNEAANLRIMRLFSRLLRGSGRGSGISV
jgi:arginase family enzyme